MRPIALLDSSQLGAIVAACRGAPTASAYDPLMRSLAWAAQVLTAALLAFLANRLLDNRKAIRDDAHELMVELRKAVRETVDEAAEYWTSKIQTEDRKPAEARLRILEADLRELLALVAAQLPAEDSGPISATGADLLAELTGGDFEGAARVRSCRLSDVERARKIAALGARLRSQASRSWRKKVRLNPKMPGTIATIAQFLGWGS